MPENIKFTKENIEAYLKELAKAFRKINGSRALAEIILIDGASVVINYNFRDYTYDNDAEIKTNSSIKEAINRVADKFSLPNDWINSDFTKTDSYSPKLREVSQHYRTFSNVVDVRTVSAEYLIAMKLRSGRVYKNDLSDIVGILDESRKNNTSISIDQINDAFERLYGSCDILPQASKDILKKAFETDDLAKLYNDIRVSEKNNADLILEFQGKFPNVVNERNVDEILANLRFKQVQANSLIPISKPTKSFAQGLDEFAKRQSGQGSPKPPAHDNSDHKHHK